MMFTFKELWTATNNASSIPKTMWLADVSLVWFIPDPINSGLSLLAPSLHCAYIPIASFISSLNHQCTLILSESGKRQNTCLSQHINLIPQIRTEQSIRLRTRYQYSPTNTETWFKNILLCQILCQMSQMDKNGLPRCQINSLYDCYSVYSLDLLKKVHCFCCGKFGDKFDFTIYLLVSI